MVAIVAAAKGRLSADHIAVGCFKGEAPEASRQREAVVDALERLAGRSGWRGH